MFAVAGDSEPRHEYPRPDFSIGGSLLLSINIDCDGATVFQCTQKKELRFKQRPHEHRMPFHWTLEDADGIVITSGGFDPGPLALDPALRGSPGRVEGCRLIPAETSMNIKVPAIEFETIEFTIQRDGEFVPFGTARVGEFPVRGGSR